MNDLVFIKWGGSLITNKNQPMTARKETIQELSLELANIILNHKDTNFILGHGSGSFGHSVAKIHGTRNGIYSPAQWRGFSDVWHAARELNNIIMESLFEAGISSMAFPPSATFSTNNREISKYNFLPLLSALKERILPVIYGDVVFDDEIGGSILSTEDVFFYLAKKLYPSRILLAGLEEAIWLDFPENTNPIKKISLENFDSIQDKIGLSASPDVTGGMIEKVKIMLNLTTEISGLKITIFSGNESGNISRILNNQQIGTCIERE